MHCDLTSINVLFRYSIPGNGTRWRTTKMTISIETIQPLNTFFKAQETTAQTRFEKSFENWRKLGDVIAEVIAITGGKNWSDKAVQKSVDEGKLDNSALTLLANLTDTQARNVLRSNCLWLAINIKDAELIVSQRKDKKKKNTSLESLRKQVAAWKKECERAERIKNPPAPGEGEGEAETAPVEQITAPETTPPTQDDFIKAMAGLMLGAREMGFDTGVIMKASAKLANKNAADVIIPKPMAEVIAA